MTIYLMGNPLVESDSIPLAFVDNLCKNFPEIDIKEIDPSENFIPEKGDIIIDTVVGIDDITVFDEVDVFIGHKLITPHDYDLWLHLKLLKKLNKLPKIYVIGVPVINTKTTKFSKISKLTLGIISSIQEILSN
ncbi:hypothetical protein ACFL1A_00330 [Patescibacteria group bacterium]